MNKKILIICRGGGDLATGIVHRLFRAGFPVLVLETDSPRLFDGRYPFPRQSMMEWRRWKV